MKARIAVLGGDGIGPEVTAEAVRVLETVASRYGHAFEFVEALIGGAAIDASGSPLPPRTIDACRSSDGVLLGAVGGPQWSDPAARVRPEQGLLELRRVLGLFANLRPVRTLPGMLDASPLRPEVIAGVDIMVVRELTGGIYFGRKSRTAHEAEDVCSYSAAEIERVTRVAGRLAMGARPAHRVGGQGQRARDLAPVAHRGRARARPGVPGGPLRAHAGRRGRHAPAPPPDELRRASYREHVRRHPHRRSLDAGRLARTAAVRVARRGSRGPL